MSESLRGSYVSPSRNWSFNSFESPSSSASGSSDTYGVPAHQWTPDLVSDSRTTSYSISSNATLIAKAFFTSAALQYTSTAIAMPWEVGRLLLQVQYIPKGTVVVSERVNEENSDDSSNDNDELYFSDIRSQSNTQSSKRWKTDERGYLLKSKSSSQNTRPYFVLPVDNAEGVWSMMKRLGRFRPEGWISLFKGLFTTSIIDFLSSVIEPVIRSMYAAAFETFFTSINSYNSASRILIPVLAHMSTGFIVSPLDLVRTRLVAQSSVAQYRKYKGPLDALSQILRDEGGVKGVYLHPHLLYPTLLDCTVRPTIGFGMPFIITQLLGPRVTEHSHPFLWSVAQLAGATLGLLFTLPIETARRRLQVQTRGNAPAIRTCVEVNPRPYQGVLDVIISIVRDESCRARRVIKMDDKVDGKRHADKNKGALLNSEESGIGQLYHGLTSRVVANALIILGPLFALQDKEDGWTEL